MGVSFQLHFRPCLPQQTALLPHVQYTVWSHSLYGSLKKQMSYCCWELKPRYSRPSHTLRAISVHTQANCRDFQCNAYRYVACRGWRKVIWHLTLGTLPLLSSNVGPLGGSCRCLTALRSSSWVKFDVLQLEQTARARCCYIQWILMCVGPCNVVMTEE